MTRLGLPAGLRVLCLGAHSDDIEIGAGGTLLRLLAEPGRVAALRWVVLAASTPIRAQEAEASAARFLRAGAAADTQVQVLAYPDGRLPQHHEAVKAEFEQLKAFAPDLILTHYRHDLHQDHRLVADLTWNTFRNHLVWEYEIPKYDGDLGNPACFVGLSTELLTRKIELLHEGFPTQVGKHWFDAETFRGLARLRAVQAGGDAPYAEAFYVRKLVV